MDKFLFIIIATLFSITCSANSTINIDSLKKVEQTVEVLQNIGNHYYNEQQDSLAMLYFNKALAIVTEEQKVLKGRLLYKKAMLIYFSGQDFEMVKPLFEEAAILHESADAELLFGFLQSYGSILIAYQEYDNGIKQLEKAIQICSENDINNLENNLLNIYSNLLAAAQTKGDYKAALEYARKGIEISKHTDNYEYRADLHYNNANIFLALASRKKAKQEYLKSLELSRKGNLPLGIANASLALGEWHSQEQEHQTAQQYFATARQYSEQLQDSRTLAIIDKMMAVNYYNQKKYDTALEYINKTINYFKETKDPREIQGNYYEKARILFAKGNSEKAIEFALKEVKNSQQISSFLYQDNSYLLLSQIEKSRQNHEQALIYHEQYVSVKDSIYEANLENKLAEESTKQNLEAAQEAQKNAELQAQLLTSRNQLFGAIALGLLAIILVGGYLFWQLQKARQQLETQNLQLIQLNETKDKFFGIIAHDIRSPIMALDSVGEQMNYYLSKNNEQKLRRLSDRVDKTAKRLTNLLDNLLNWALLQTGMIPYHPKSVNLKSVSNDIFELYEPIATTKKIILENNISTETMVFADESALSTIIRNLVNNALKFTPENGIIRISEVVKDDKIFIEINDTGTGISAEKLPKLFALERTSTDGTAGEKGSGLGLMLCKELVELNKGTIKAISELGKGSTFIFSVPQP